MSSIGFFQVRAFTSNAQLPLKDVAIIVTAPDNTAIAMRLTDRSGLIPAIEIPVPDKSESQEPGSVERPYALVNLYAYLEGFEQVISEGIQIFAGTTTLQNLEMIPLSDFPGEMDDFVFYDTPPQNL